MPESTHTSETHAYNPVCAPDSIGDFKATDTVLRRDMPIQSKSKSQPHGASTALMMGLSVRNKTQKSRSNIT